MNDRELHLYMARVFLAQARAARHNPGWHATLMSWVANRRRRAGVSFYMVAEMAIERTIEMLAGPSMQIAEVCQDADGFKHVESVIEDLDDLPAGMKLYATTQRNHG